MPLELKVYCRHLNGNDFYQVEKTDNGWRIGHLTTQLNNSDCDKQGVPDLFKELNHDSINYPEELGKYMEFLWDQATEENMPEKKIQEHLNELGEWISTVEKSTPRGDFWSKYD